MDSNGQVNGPGSGDLSPEIFVLSDGTGETAEKLVQASLIQFGESHAHVSRFKSLKSVAQVDAILEEAKDRKALVVYTVVQEDLRAGIAKHGRLKGVRCLDLLGPLLMGLSELLRREPALKPGLLHEVNEDYFRRIDAIEFTVKHDDGSNPDNLLQADIVLVGVSRSSKTPLSIFLSHKGWKVANVPLVKGIDPPKALFEIDQSKIIGLIIDAEALAKIRKERLIRMGRDPSGHYASLTNIREEIEWVRQLYSRNRRWPIFDVTNKALEETAAEIERTIASRQKLA
jgi:[pyruvate, water dikinase]-phosphate phosphotransferase / [pyruvate, water dikinase] kinase